MKDYKKINIDSIGTVEIRKSSRAKHLSIRIKPYEGVSVTIPQRVSFLTGEHFAISKKEWILKHLPRVISFEKSKIIFDETTDYRTKHHKLVISKGSCDKTRVKISSSLIEIIVASNLAINSEEVQEIIKLGIIKTIRLEAKEYIPNRVEKLALLFGFKYNKIFLKNLRSRWGSCSGKNNINLNIHLMRLPDDLIDYVILHELVHTIHKNHGKYFWAKLEDVLPNSKVFDKQLKKFSPNYF